MHPRPLGVAGLLSAFVLYKNILDPHHPYLWPVKKYTAIWPLKLFGPLCCRALLAASTAGLSPNMPERVHSGRFLKSRKKDSFQNTLFHL